jgi:membrane protein YdbS with pleckstrin-like domain
MKAKKKSKQAVPVEGDVIGLSALAMIASMTVCAILTLVAIVGLIAYFTPGSGLSVWALVAGIAVVVLCPLIVLFQVHLLKVKERLVLGADRFQVLHCVGGEDVVVTQIPYANIKEVTFESGGNQRRVGIDLHDMEEPQTFQTKGDFEITRNLNGFDYVIGGGYKEPLESIYQMLCARIDQHQAAQGKLARKRRD